MTFVEIFRALQDAGIHYVLVGGLAVNLHGIDRSTFDVDLVLATDRENLGRFIDMAKKRNMVPNIPVSLDALASPEQIERWHNEKGMLAFSLRAPGNDAYVIDILVKPVVPYQELAAGATKSSLMGSPVLIASKEHLIRMKSNTGRIKDREDVEMLKKLLASEPNGNQM